MVWKRVNGLPTASTAGLYNSNKTNVGLKARVLEAECQVRQLASLKPANTYVDLFRGNTSEDTLKNMAQFFLGRSSTLTKDQIVRHLSLHFHTDKYASASGDLRAMLDATFKEMKTLAKAP